jgi:hypothetical protein
MRSLTQFIGFIQDYLVLESKASPFGEELRRSEKRFGQSRGINACGLASFGRANAKPQANFENICLDIV